MPLRLASVIIGVLALTLVLSGQEPAPLAGSFRLPPVDEAAQDSTFLAFRDRLIRTLRSHDVDTAVAAAEPSLRPQLRDWLSFGTPISHMWAELDHLLNLGGSFTTTRGKQSGRREFCAPYTYSTYPRPVPLAFSGELDPWVITGEKVPMRSEPRSSSNLIAVLTHELVAVNGMGGPPNPPIQWIGVVVGTQSGFVPADQIRNPEDFHACFAKIGDQWQMTVLDRGLGPY